jgi:hypothetical protein
MKLLAVLCVVAVVSAVGVGSASARTERQQDAAITALTAKLGCLVRYPVTQYFDYAWFGLPGSPGPYAAPANPIPSFSGFDPSNPATYPFAPAGLALNNWGPTPGLDFSFGFTPDTWLLGIKNTSGCRAKFARAPNPNPRVVARVAGLRQLLH